MTLKSFRLRWWFSAAGAALSAGVVVAAFAPPVPARAARAGVQRARTPDDVARIVARYVDAIGGAAAVNAVTTRITRGTFVNGRGLTAPFATYFKAPHRTATIIGRQSIDDGMGSGRAYDGASGWDKNFIGTGVRDLKGAELDALARNATAFPVAHLAESCDGATVEASSGVPNVDVVRCQLPDNVDRWVFDRQTGLATQHETAVVSQARTSVTYFEDYRRVDGLMIAFRTRTVIGGNTVMYTADSVRHQVTVDDSVFKKPR